MVEQAIAASVLVLGLLAAAGRACRFPATAGFVALFAVFNVYAHGADMSGGLLPAAFGAGFIIATAALHGLGIGSGLLLKRNGQRALSRAAGGAIAVCGILLLCV